MIDRRSLAASLSLLPLAANRALAAETFADIEKDTGGRLGVCVIDTGSSRRLSHREDERFALCSTHKLLLAGAVLARCDAKALTLDTRLPYGEADLVAYSPVTKPKAGEGGMSVAALCAAAVTISDNTAANLLLKALGGPAAFTGTMRALGDDVTRLDRFEPELNSNLPNDERDTSTPLAVAKTAQKLLAGSVLQAGSREKLLQWLKDSRTGLERLRASLPADWQAGDKTGSGSNGAAHDVAILFPPGRAPLIVASYLSGSFSLPATLNAAHARVAKAVVDWVKA